jgi:translation initiation factor IF-3
VIQKPYQHRRRAQEFIKANHHIRYPEVRVLTEKGETIGVMSSSEAMQKAQEADRDLVLITDVAQPPVVKIIELSKHKYQLQQKQAENRKRAKVQELKEVRFSPFMGEQDFESRLKKVINFLEKGNKVRLNLLFKGREITKKEFGYEVFEKIISRTADVAIIEIAPKLLGRKLLAQLSPAGKKKKEEQHEESKTENP